MSGICWTLTLQLEDNETSVVTGSKQVQLRMRCDNPESVVLATEGLKRFKVGRKRHNKNRSHKVKQRKE